MPIVVDDDAGTYRKSLWRVLNLMRVSLTLPLADLLIAYERDNQGATAFENIVGKRVLQTRPFDALRNDCDFIRTQKLHAFLIDRELAALACIELEDRGQFYFDGRIGYVFVGAT